MNEIQDEYREYKKLCRVEDDPGVSGLAQLGRNAIERVTELERMLAERDADIVKLGTALISAERERDAIKGDYDEAAHFARHFIRDDPEITPRGAIIRLADKCTSLLCRLQAAELGPDGQAICYGCIDEGPANLIAAAPELAKALSVIVDYLGSTAECGYDPFAAEPLIESARAALAKAGVK